MPPRRTRKAVPPTNNSTLGKFFAIRTAKPQQPAVMQPTLTSMLGRAARRRADTASPDRSSPDDLPVVKDEAMEVDVSADSDPEPRADAVSICSSTSAGSARIRLGGAGPNDLSDSDSDGELVDASSILGPGSAATPSGYGLRSQAPTRATPTHAVPTPSAAPYRNSLKSLVRETRKQKYDLDFLEAYMQRPSADCGASDGDDGDSKWQRGDEGSAAVESVLEALPRREFEHIRAQVGADKSIQRRPVQLSLFHTGGRRSALERPSHDNDYFRGLRLADSDPVERVCRTHADTGGFICSIVESQWLTAQAHSGWRLTQSIGDALLQTMCHSSDGRIASGAHESLRLFVDMGMSSWELRLPGLLALMEGLQGVQRDAVHECCIPDGDCGEDDGNSSSTSTLPSVYVEITRPRPMGATSTNAERVAFLIDIASRSFGFDTVKDSCDVLVMIVAALLDHGNRMHRLSIQQALARAAERISPPTKWALVWPACVAWLGARFSRVSLPAQLFIVDSLPTSSQRCMQLRRSLSFMLLRMQSPEYIMDEQSMEKLAVAVTLPSQIMLRMACELMDADEELFRVSRDTDFVRLEAAIGLLGNLLDSTQVMRDVRDASEIIYKRLTALSRRINDGMATRLDKTLAKDAIQTLLVRISMTVVSANGRLDPIYAPSSTLDTWLSGAQKGSDDHSAPAT
ncbi:hypothetical protein LPJ61_005100 [Coemansia biformis]|uniref:Uncharacterized protein n=1 Tax=Coemansia biformis TaxID=1286918 RepID=A0A9W7Y3N2_9FUNG|nr:hypothetical protein LPJ61_005100 [Coemansia biformis]